MSLGGRKGENKDSNGFTSFAHNLRVETDTNNMNIPNNNSNSNNSNNNTNIDRNSQSPRRHPHYLLHPDDSSELNINVLNLNLTNTNSGGSRNDTPPIRTPPQSPRGGNSNNNNLNNSTNESPPLTPSNLPPIPWINDVRLSPPIPSRHAHHELNNHNNISHRPILDARGPAPAPIPVIFNHINNNPNINNPFNLESPSFPVPHSPQAIPVPIPFPVIPKSPRPKLPSSITEQTKQEGPIKWEKGPVIGRGGFGCVYMGMRDNGELIAVKQLELDENEDPKSRAVFIIYFGFSPHFFLPNVVLIMLMLNFRWYPRLHKRLT